MGFYPSNQSINAFSTRSSVNSHPHVTCWIQTTLVPVFGSPALGPFSRLKERNKDQGISFGCALVFLLSVCPVNFFLIDIYKMSSTTNHSTSPPTLDNPHGDNLEIAISIVLVFMTMAVGARLWGRYRYRTLSSTAEARFGESRFWVLLSDITIILSFVCILNIFSWQDRYYDMHGWQGR